MAEVKLGDVVLSGHDGTKYRYIFYREESGKIRVDYEMNYGTMRIRDYQSFVKCYINYPVLSQTVPQEVIDEYCLIKALGGYERSVRL